MKRDRHSIAPIVYQEGPTVEIWSITDATSSNSGAMSAADKAALDALIASGGVGSQVGFAFIATAAVASNTTTTIPFDNSIPQNTEGDSFPALDTTITPKYTTSLLEVLVTLPLVSGSTFLDLTFALFRDAGVDAIAVASVTVDAVNYSRELTIRAVVTAGSLAATTFKIRWGRSTGTGYINRINSTAALFNGVLKASMTVREIKQ